MNYWGFKEEREKKVIPLPVRLIPDEIRESGGWWWVVYMSVCLSVCLSLAKLVKISWEMKYCAYYERTEDILFETTREKSGWNLSSNFLFSAFFL